MSENRLEIIWTKNEGDDMASIEKIHENLGAAVCRRCICKIDDVDLLPKDCVYEDYPQMCTCCKKVHNIVVGFSVSGKLKMAFK